MPTRRSWRSWPDAVAELAPTAREMGMFGVPVEPAEGASAFERLLARTGRDPYWR